MTVKLCKDCKHFSDEKCVRDRISIVTGKKVYGNIDCYTERLGNMATGCGYDGKYWEPVNG